MRPSVHTKVCGCTSNFVCRKSANSQRYAHNIFEMMSKYLTGLGFELQWYQQL
jgi:hypothetical protein